MPILLAWGNQQHTLLIGNFIEPWTPDDLMHMIDEGVRMLSSVSHSEKVGVIFDYQQSANQIPTKFLPAVARIRQIGKLNRGKIVIVKAPYFLKALIQIAQEFAPEAYSDLHYAATMEEAYEILGYMPASVKK